MASERRWGRVTVEGWIREDALASRNYVMVFGTQRAEEAPAVIYTTPTGAYSVSVEFLPEPVTFKDGDVVSESGGNIYVRRSGRWDVLVRAEKYKPVALAYADTEIAGFIQRGNAYRLVPEANDD
jgi:hypothetical protein